MLRTIFAHFPLLVCLFLLQPLTAQDDRNILDEVQATPEIFARAMQIHNPTEAQFDTVWAAVQNYNAIDNDTTSMLIEHALDITKNHKIRNLEGKALYLKGKNLLEFDNMSEKGFQTVDEAIEILRTENETILLSEIESFLGGIYARTNQYETALEHHLKGLDYVKATRDSLLLLIVPNISIGSIYYRMGNFEKAAVFTGDAIQIMEVSGYDMFLYAALGNQARILQKIGDRHRDLAELSGYDTKVQRDSAQLFYQKGLESAKKALETAKKRGKPFELLVATTAVADLLTSTGDYKAALKIGKESMEMAKKEGTNQFLVSNHIILARAQRNLGQHTEAFGNAKAGYEIVKNDPSAGMILAYEEELYKNYKATGQTQKALEMMEIIQKRLRESNDMSIKKVVADAETKYRTAEKENEILTQKNNILELQSTNEKIAKQRNYIMLGGTFLGILGFFGFQLNRAKKERNDKKAFAEALIFAQEEERKRIAQDLHDGIGQSLLLIKKQMNESTQITLENQQMISDTLDEVRSISQDLHPFQLEKFGLTNTLNDMLLKIERSTELFLSKEIDNIDAVLPPKSQIHLYRVVQEAFNNIVKHAQATAAKIEVQNLPNKIQVTIQDNGKGFDLEMTVAKSKSLGIKTMHERISAIGGELKIGKGSSGGTRLDIVLPK